MSSDTPRTDALSKTATDIYKLDADGAALWAADYAALCGTLERELAEQCRQLERENAALTARVAELESDAKRNTLTAPVVEDDPPKAGWAVYFAGYKNGEDWEKAIEPNFVGIGDGWVDTFSSKEACQRDCDKSNASQAEGQRDAYEVRWFDPAVHLLQKQP